MCKIINDLWWLHSPGPSENVEIQRGQVYLYITYRNNAADICGILLLSWWPEHSILTVCQSVVGFHLAWFAYCQGTNYYNRDIHVRAKSVFQCRKWHDGNFQTNIMRMVYYPWCVSMETWNFIEMLTLASIIQHFNGLFCLMKQLGRRWILFRYSH